VHSTDIRELSPAYRFAHAGYDMSVIASEAKQSRFACACFRDRDCFGVLRTPRNDAGNG
jgi:hypothetical protein